MENEFIAQYRVGRQISQDEWEVYHRTLKVTDKTTVREIFDWYKLYEKKNMLELRIIQIQKETK